MRPRRRLGASTKSTSRRNRSRCGGQVGEELGVSSGRRLEGRVRKTRRRLTQRIDRRSEVDRLGPHQDLDGIAERVEEPGKARRRALLVLPACAVRTSPRWPGTRAPRRRHRGRPSRRCSPARWAAPAAWGGDRRSHRGRRVRAPRRQVLAPVGARCGGGARPPAPSGRPGCLPSCRVPTWLPARRSAGRWRRRPPRAARAGWRRRGPRPRRRPRPRWPTGVR